MKCLYPYATKTKAGVPILVPCGRCIACRINRSREWTQRLVNEYQFSDNAFFLTLTYNDENIPYRQAFLSDKSYVCPSKKDIQDFIKRLRMDIDRHYCKNSLRYYFGSEFGQDTQRLHYHGIVFNLPVDYVEQPSETWEKGLPLSVPGKYGFSMCNRHIDDLWQKGFVTIGEFSLARAGYVASYFLDKEKVPYIDEILDSDKKNFFNFSLMSQGLGRAFADANADGIRSGSIRTLLTPKGSMVSLPKYYRRRNFTEEELREIISGHEEEISKSFFKDVDSEQREMLIRKRQKFYGINKKSL